MTRTCADRQQRIYRKQQNENQFFILSNEPNEEIGMNRIQSR